MALSATQRSELARAYNRVYARHNPKPAETDSRNIVSSNLAVTNLLTVSELLVKPDKQKILQEICREYEQSVNKTTKFIEIQLTQWLQLFNGEPDAILYAISETAAAPRPSWAYCNAILKRIYQERQEGYQEGMPTLPDE